VSQTRLAHFVRVGIGVPLCTVALFGPLVGVILWYYLGPIDIVGQPCPNQIGQTDCRPNAESGSDLIFYLMALGVGVLLAYGVAQGLDSIAKDLERAAYRAKKKEQE